MGSLSAKGAGLPVAGNCTANYRSDVTVGSLPLRIAYSHQLLLVVCCLIDTSIHSTCQLASCNICCTKYVAFLLHKFSELGRINLKADVLTTSTPCLDITDIVNLVQRQFLIHPYGSCCFKALTSALYHRFMTVQYMCHNIILTVFLIDSIMIVMLYISMSSMYAPKAACSLRCLALFAV